MKEEMQGKVIEKQDVGYLNEILLDDNKEIKIVPSQILKDIPHLHLLQWCVENALYQIPTIELINWLKKQIAGKDAIEICSGRGGLGKALGIPATDSYVQTTPALALQFTLMGQAPVVPPASVAKLEALEAVLEFRPKVVVGSFVTQCYIKGDEDGPIGSSVYGPNEIEIFKNIETYIHIGNEIVHKDKRLLKYPYKEYHFDWLHSRAFDQSKNVIWEWNK